MKNKLCLFAALILSMTLVSCSKLQARIEIRTANEMYDAENFPGALKHYTKARKIDPSFPELDRMVGYSSLAQFQPENNTPANQKHADRAIEELKRYLLKVPNDTVAREALINLFLNANRTGQAINFFKDSLKRNPNDLDSVKSIATLYAKEGNFAEALNWYEKITLLDSRNPEAFYTFGVVLYEKVAKNPPADMAERFMLIEKGKAALTRASALKPDYFEAAVYTNLLFREQAKIEMDPLKQQELMKEADVYRNRAVAISKSRKKA